MSLTIQYGTPITFVGSAAGTDSATLPTHVKDDVIVAFAYRAGSQTAPTLPDGWTGVTTEAHEDSGNECAARVAYRVATDGSTVSGSWTNANHVLFSIYRGVSITSPIVKSGTWSGAGDWYRFGTLTDTLATSWVATFGGHNATGFDFTQDMAGRGWVVRRHRDSSPPAQAVSADTGGPTGGGNCGGMVAYQFDEPNVWVTHRAELRAGTGEVEVSGYRMSPRARVFSTRAERARGGGVRLLGDHMEDPVGLTVTVTVAALTGGLPAAYQDAYALVSQAERATLVTLHAGAFPTAGLTAYDMLPVGDALDVTLHFAVASAP